MLVFKDLPDTTTPINSENLNENFNESVDKNILSAYSTGSVTLDNNTYEKIPLTSNALVGNKLSINNGGIKIGKGVSYVKASAFITFSTVASNLNRHHLLIYKNNSSVYDIISRFNGNWETISSNETLIPVSENDIIYLYARNQDAAGSIVNTAFMTVEVFK